MVPACPAQIPTQTHTKTCSSASIGMPPRPPPRPPTTLHCLLDLSLHPPNAPRPFHLQRMMSPTLDKRPLCGPFSAKTLTKVARPNASIFHSLARNSKVHERMPLIRHATLLSLRKLLPSPPKVRTSALFQLHPARQRHCLRKRPPLRPRRSRRRSPIPDDT